MDFTPDQMWASMGIMARIVTGVLLAMAVAGLGVFLERIFVLARSGIRSRRFAQASAAALDGGRLDEVLGLCGRYRGSHLAELVAAGLSAFRRGAAAAEQTAEQGLDRLELTQRVMQRKGEALAADIRRGFPVLASVGSVAPFVGLLGTVVGIIDAFEGIARTGSGGLGSVSAGIAEALVVTALGLAVAIPAVLAFNFLSTRADRLDLALGHAAEELLEALVPAARKMPVARLAVAEAALAAGEPAAQAASLPAGAVDAV